MLRTSSALVYNDLKGVVKVEINIKCDTSELKDILRCLTFSRKDTTINAQFWEGLFSTFKDSLQEPLTKLETDTPD